MRYLVILAISLFVIISLALTLSSPNQIRGNPEYWHLEQVDGIWWFKSPEGQREFIISVQSVRPEQIGVAEPHYKSKNIANWPTETAKQIRNCGFKAVGAWSDARIHKEMPYFKDLNLLKWTHLPISDPHWEAHVKLALEKQVVPKDKNLIGYYTDNEVDWKKHELEAEKYFEVVHRLLKEFDPNHLNMGVRFNRRPSKKVLRASIGKVDVHSVNQYGGAYKNMIKDINKITGSPVIISEFSFFSDENLSGNKNMNWPGEGRVNSQLERAKRYKEFVESLAECSFIVGADWFQWNDEPPSGRRGDGEDLNVGVMSVYDEPYTDLVKAIKETSKNINTIHSNSDKYQKHSAWKSDPELHE